MKKFFVIAIVVFGFAICKAQNSRAIDSLNALIKKLPDDTNKVNALFELGRRYDIFQSKEHINYFISALNLAKRLEFKKGMPRIYRSLTQYCIIKGMYDRSEKYCFEFLDLLSELKMEEEKFNVYSLLGNISLRKGNLKQAQAYYHTVRAHRFQGKDEFKQANSYVNLMIVCMATKEHDSALWYGNKAAELYEHVDKKSEMANALSGVAEAFRKLNKYNAAQTNAFESLRIYKSIKNPLGVCNALNEIGQIYKAQNKLDSAIKTFEVCLKYADTLNLLEMRRDCYKSLSDIYKLSGNYAKALEDHVLFKAYEDSLGMEQQKGKMLQVEFEYDLSKKEKRLLEQSFEIESKTKQQNFLLLGIGAIVILLLISYRAYKQKKESSEIIAKQKELVEDKQKEILDSINYAKRIQNAILAREESIKKYLPESFLLYLPKDIVAGDFYFFEVTDEHIFYAAADCTGHGVPGALMSVVCSNSLTRCVKEFDLSKPGDILDKARLLVVETLKKSGEEVKDGMDISLLCISRKNGQVTWAGANNSLCYIHKGNFVEIKADKQPIGLFDNPKPFTTHLLQLEKNDMLYLFTDGYADQFGGPKGKKFKYKQFEEILIRNASREPSEQLSILKEKFVNWKAQLDQVDDVCVIGIRV